MMRSEQLNQIKTPTLIIWGRNNPFGEVPRSSKKIVVIKMVTDDIIQAAAHALYHALRTGEPIAPLTETYEGLTVDDAYKISLATYALRKTAGEKDIGKKIGITSDAVMNMLGVNQPDFGFLTDRMWAKNNVVDTANMILPRAEAEIAFKLKSDLKGPGVTEADVLAATESVAACFEVVDSRVRDWNIKIQDTIKTENPSQKASGRQR